LIVARYSYESKTCICYFWEFLLICFSSFLFADRRIPIFSPYSWLLVPVVANFCIGYFARDVYTAIKIIILGFSLQAGILLALLYSFSAYGVFFGVVIIYSYNTLQVPLDITVSLVGTAVKEDSTDIIAVCTHLVEKMKQIIDTLLGKVRR
jgi:hypothetical protein